MSEFSKRASSSSCTYFLKLHVDFLSHSFHTLGCVLFCNLFYNQLVHFNSIWREEKKDIKLYNVLNLVYWLFHVCFYSRFLVFMF